jgi:hypothetical protein
MNPVKKHPNATTALVSSLGLGSIIVTVGSRFGLHLSGEEGLAVAGVLATGALFLGRNGLLGTYRAVKKIVLYGTGNKPRPQDRRRRRA